MRGRLLVPGHLSEQRARVPDIRVPRARAVGIEGQTAVERGRPLRRARRALDEDAGLQVMCALQLRHIARDGEGGIEAEEAEALLVSERRDGAVQAAAETGLRQQVERV